MDLTEPAVAAEALERFLGDPRDPGSRISFREALALDEREAFPERGVAALDAWGLPRFYVPEASGGALRSFEVLTALARAVARRDLTVAVAHAKTFLGAGPTWIAGTGAQKEALGAAIVAGSKVALALTEEAHGGDLLATETTAAPTPTGYVLSGEKWLINNATWGDAITVLARTEPRGGPRGFSLFLVTKRDVSGVSCLPKIPTHGVRGADISGVRFERSPVPAGARIGREGQGLEIMMRSLSLTRALLPTISLGALDTGLREVMAFARSRRIGGGAVDQIPHARRILTEAFVELLALDALVRAGARSVHAAPERLPVWSAVVKYLVPVRVDAALRRLAVVLGARHYLRGVPFEKLLRDHALVALFDGSTVVNLGALAHELPRLHAARPGDDGALEERIATIHDLRRPLPGFRPDRIDLVSRGGDDGPRALLSARAEIDRLPAGEVDPDLGRYLSAMTGAIGAELGASAAIFQANERPRAQSPEVFAAAERHALLHAATTCVLVWLRNRSTLDGFFARGEWLALALWQLLGPAGSPPAAAWYERVFLRLAELCSADRVLALEPIAASSISSRGPG
jgi:alkylation response protein AidB-like acyl-CoA dehydrogenase